QLVSWVYRLERAMESIPTGADDPTGDSPVIAATGRAIAILQHRLQDPILTRWLHAIEDVNQRAIGGRIVGYIPLAGHLIDVIARAQPIQILLRGFDPAID